MLGSSLQRLLGEFEDEQKLQVSLGHLRETTRKKQAQHITRGLRFLAKNSITPESRLNALNGDLFKDYLNFRKAEVLEAGGSITATVVKQELQTIRKMFMLGKTRKLCSEAQLPVIDFDVERETASVNVLT